MTLVRGVTFPPASTVGGGVLAQAQSLPDGWERGVEFASDACLAAGEHLFCPTSPTEKSFQGTVLSEFIPYGVEVSVVCSTLAGTRNHDELRARASRALAAKSEVSVGRLLATGITAGGEDTGNPNLGDATPSGTTTDPVIAMVLIEDLLAQLGDIQGWVHVTPAILTHLVAADVVYQDLTGWHTPTGHLVVASPGYVGAIDGLLVATAEVFASVGSVDRVETIDRSDNRLLAVFEAPALAVFDDCFNVSVALEGTSP